MRDHENVLFNLQTGISSSVDGDLETDKKISSLNAEDPEFSSALEAAVDEMYGLDLNDCREFHRSNATIGDVVDWIVRQ